MSFRFHMAFIAFLGLAWIAFGQDKSTPSTHVDGDGVRPIDSKILQDDDSVREIRESLEKLYSVTSGKLPPFEVGEVKQQSSSESSPAK